MLVYCDNVHKLHVLTNVFYICAENTSCFIMISINTQRFINHEYIDFSADLMIIYKL